MHQKPASHRQPVENNQPGQQLVVGRHAPEHQDEDGAGDGMDYDGDGNRAEQRIDMLGLNFGMGNRDT